VITKQEYAKWNFAEEKEIKMKRLMFLAPVALFSFLVCFCLSAFAQAAEPGSVDQAVGLLPQILANISQGKYLLAGALITLVIVFIVKQYVLPKVNLSTGALPLISLVVGALSAVALGISGGATPAQAALALLSGPTASALWDIVIKFMVPKKAAA
jgi:branched-subunit amino acid transport protein AzlD